MYYNEVRLIGNLGKDPVVRTFESGDKLANFSLATTKRYKNRNGELVDQTDWHTIAVRGNLAVVAEKYLKKGSQVLVCGELTYRHYTNKDGNDMIVTEIVCNNLQMLDKREVSAAPQQPAPSAQSVEEDLPF